ncbi:MAG: hypothetical protein ISR64_09165 [Deltaproteobacteria bacterium]|nr:hypothetical protein [Deltaproteobacteria bacterium]
MAYLILTDIRLGHCEEAWDLLEWLDPKSVDEKLWKGIVDEFSSGKGACAPPAGFTGPVDSVFRCDGHVRVDSDPEGAGVSYTQLYKGPMMIETDPTPIDIRNLCPGNLQILLTKWGYEPKGLGIRLKPDDNLAVAVDLTAYDRDEFLDRFRKPVVFGVEWISFAGRSEDGKRWGLFDGFSVGLSVSLLLRDFRLSGQLHYLRIPEKQSGFRHAAVARARAQYVFPIYRDGPHPLLDSRVISVSLGLGAEAMVWDPVGLGGFVDLEIQIYWVTLRAFYNRDWGLTTGRGIEWTSGFGTSANICLR